MHRSELEISGMQWMRGIDFSVTWISNDPRIVSLWHTQTLLSLGWTALLQDRCHSACTHWHLGVPSSTEWCYKVTFALSSLRDRPESETGHFHHLRYKQLGEKLKNSTYTSRIRSPFEMPALSAAPPGRTALTCCSGAYNSPLMLRNCPPSLTCPRTLNP